jgi:mRNA interferase RelE/StbE
MSDYSLTFAQSARKVLEKLPAREVNRIFPKIEALTKEPRPEGCRKLVGELDLWRIRVGEYRVIYSINDKEQVVDIVVIRHRRDAYR